MRHQTTNRSRGFASIIVTMVMMLVISLIVVGFAAVSRREQRQSLDQQLSTQAFYAAESGVEDARAVIKQDLANGNPVNKDDCTKNNPGGTYPVPANNGTLLDGENQVSYTCLKVDVAPKDALYSGVGEDYIVVPINTSTPVDSLQLVWQPSTAPTGNPSECPAGTANVFSSQPSWACKYGVLRADIVPVAGNLTRTNLQSGQLTSFFVPSRAGGTGAVDYGADKGKPNVVAANCDVSAYTTCRATIGNLGGGTKYVLRISSLYKASDISVVANQSGNPLPISGAQAIIDSTGKAQDVLRRIQVRMPLSVSNTGGAPAYAIQTNGSICKRFTVTDTSFNIDGNITDKDPTNPTCLPASSGNPVVVPNQCVNGGTDIVLTTDTTGSLDNTWKTDKAIYALRRSLSYFVNNVNIAPSANHMSLIGFSESRNRIYNGMTSTTQPLLNSISTLTPDNSTQYIIGLNYTYYEMTQDPKARPESPKTLLFVTDGQPDDDYGPILQRMSDIKKLGAKIFVVGINGQSYSPTKVKALDENLLRNFAANGGWYRRADSEAQLQQIIVDIAKAVYCV